MEDGPVELREIGEVAPGFRAGFRTESAMQVFGAVEDHLRDEQEAVRTDGKRVMPIGRGVQDNSADSGQAGQDGSVAFAIVAQELVYVFGNSFVPYEVRNAHAPTSLTSRWRICDNTRRLPLTSELAARQRASKPSRESISKKL